MNHEATYFSLVIFWIVVTIFYFFEVDVVDYFLYLLVNVGLAATVAALLGFIFYVVWEVKQACIEVAQSRYDHYDGL